MRLNHASQYWRLHISKSNKDLVVFEVLRQSDIDDLWGATAYLASG